MKSKTTLTLDEATRGRLRRIADRQGVSQSAIVEALVAIAATVLDDRGA